MLGNIKLCTLFHIDIPTSLNAIPMPLIKNNPEQNISNGIWKLYMNRNKNIVLRGPSSLSIATGFGNCHAITCPITINKMANPFIESMYAMRSFICIQNQIFFNIFIIFPKPKTPYILLAYI